MFFSHLDLTFIHPDDIENTVWAWVVNCSVITRGLLWCLFPELRRYEEPEWPSSDHGYKQFVATVRVYIILFVTQHDIIPSMAIKRMIFTHRQHASLGLFTFWWLHDTSQFIVQRWWWFTIAGLAPGILKIRSWDVTAFGEWGPVVKIGILWGGLQKCVRVLKSKSS